MILDQIVHLDRYKAADTNIMAALEFLYSHRDEEDLPDGRYEIIKDEVTAFVISKNTVEEAAADMEIQPHKPLCNADRKSEFVKKIICKVRINSDQGVYGR